MVDRREIPYFRRVQIVRVSGPDFEDDLLQVVAEFHDLNELHLFDTSISSRALAQWREEHPQVKVTVERSVQ